MAKKKNNKQQQQTKVEDPKKHESDQEALDNSMDEKKKSDGMNTPETKSMKTNEDSQVEETKDFGSGQIETEEKIKPMKKRGSRHDLQIEDDDEEQKMYRPQFSY